MNKGILFVVYTCSIAGLRSFLATKTTRTTNTTAIAATIPIIAPMGKFMLLGDSLLLSSTRAEGQAASNAQHTPPTVALRGALHWLPEIEHWYVPQEAKAQVFTLPSAHVIVAAGPV
jgi:hypothetical protein